MAPGVRPAGIRASKKDQSAYHLRQRKVRVTQRMDDRLLAVMKHREMADLTEAYRHVVHRELQGLEVGRPAT